MAFINSNEDSKWAEVKHINCYAMFMGYLWMAMRGLGFLVVTWTTVLLGGFVSMLGKKDFWCLTVIMLVQTAGVFNIHLNGILTAVPLLCLGFLSTMNNIITREGGRGRRNDRPLVPCLPVPSGWFSVWARKLAALGVASVQAMVFTMILCPLAALYGFGLCITTAISLWRLVEHDYGTASGDEANRKPALYVLYVLAVFQGAVCCYRGILGIGGKRIARQVAEAYSFEYETYSSVLGYLDVLTIGCQKDPSFARGRNLITYAAELMESESPDDVLSGARILDALIMYDDGLSPGDKQKGKRVATMVQLLAGSSSSGKIVQKLMKALASRSACDSMMKKTAARIVLCLAGDIRLKQFPEVIGCILSLLDASEQKVDGFRDLLLHGLLMVEKIVAYEDNRGFITANQYAQVLAVRILWPLSSRLLHRINHETWSGVVNAALQVMCCWLATARGESSTSLNHYVSSNRAAIGDMEYILTCPQCHEKTKILAMKVLITQLGEDQSKRNFIEQLLGIFLDYDKEWLTKELAGEKLVSLSQESRINANIILQGDRYVDGIVSVFGMHESYECRIIAAGILEGLCGHYVKDDECFENLKKLVIVEVIRQISRWKTTICRGLYSEERRIMSTKFLVALLSLLVMLYDKLISTEQDLSPFFSEKDNASQGRAFNFATQIKELLRFNSRYYYDMDVENLRIVTFVAKMTVSIIRMKHLHTYVRKQDLEQIIALLQDARREMMEVDGYLLLSGNYDTLTSNLSLAVTEFHHWKNADDRGASGPSVVSVAQSQFHLPQSAEDREARNKGKEPEITEIR